MSLDISILDNDGYPTDHEVSLSPDSHFQLMQQAMEFGLEQLKRMHDYYGDVDYTKQETLLLQQETKTLVSCCAGEPGFRGIVESIQDLVRHAVNDEKPVVAIAD